LSVFENTQANASFLECQPTSNFFHFAAPNSPAPALDFGPAVLPRIKTGQKKPAKLSRLRRWILAQKKSPKLASTTHT
jgi:hypothetical protein